ncbi:hypothetical protein A2715_00695 [Candidatus Woesebacteria bacterium RIFCSPHIGHO2_01_FULL_39_32]|uniref:Uncharacterized protein n=1 Tax=Candidatus Woesebacteria bacterium RIFCSPLOWO2_01_FULL_39_25 TaxID=1802521 RepID=A0A1F8BJ82_9BACT|nr:MAG: hypothetical protein A2124_03495 [Candidatus Woesebacteria bacterium GWB1_37_5]OGM24433.1 MAG: hypothetical protein A2715_00695 [Candidatus Woesebacteria bacterium RIFCSPHIGHO2_01_FULL_39_32]OGM35562.1 MAG: hypothetical protein A3F01_02575 [Candidatus Woesebacteria bacterium RIFCSPHIGHO2_12_FULL_38_11]OGM63739.1 MAG: hypothetical protein A2893_02030 [Candidatus Woesebacteria bacterium RIFCSPLOWO2_01_FULL_39_25]
MKKRLITAVFILLVIVILVIQLQAYLYLKGKPCTCYGIEIDIGGKKCVGFETFCSGLTPINTPK